MPATAVAITPEDWLTDVDLGDPDLRLAHLRTLVGCAAVQPILLADDLVMWVANTVDASSLNIAATDLIMITATVPNQTIYGTVVCTGHPSTVSTSLRSRKSGRNIWPTTRLSNRWTTPSINLQRWASRKGQPTPTTSRRRAGG